MGDDYIGHPPLSNIGGDIPNPPVMYDYDFEIATNRRGPEARPRAPRSSGVLHVL